jgi:glycosyltransferase involved in cell wall biosynthesis
MKILALTFGDENCASSYYRILQYKDVLRNAGIQLTDFPAKEFDDFDSIKNFDCVFLQKTILSTSKVRRIAKSAKRLIYDADDRMWLSPFKKHSFITQMRINYRMRSIAKLSSFCTVANETIAEDIRMFGGNPRVIPMALDANIWYPEKQEHEQIIIGWTGAPVNLPYLEEILPSVKAALQGFGNARFFIHCGKDPEWNDIEYTYIPFVPGSEPEIVRSFDVGLLPLPNDSFSDGKSPIKALQYLASGVPVICSKTLACKNLLKGQAIALFSENLTEWSTNLKILCQDSEYRRQISSDGLKFFEKNHDLTEVSQQIIGLLQN